MFDGIEMAARVIWLHRPNLSVCGKELVKSQTRSTRSMLFCQTINSLNFDISTIHHLPTTDYQLTTLFIAISGQVNGSACFVQLMQPV